MKTSLMCPHCGKSVQTFKNPFPTVDIIAVEAKIFTLEALPKDLAFDHGRILKDYYHLRRRTPDSASPGGGPCSD